MSVVRPIRSAAPRSDTGSNHSRAQTPATFSPAARTPTQNGCMHGTCFGRAGNGGPTITAPGAVSHLRADGRFSPVLRSHVQTVSPGRGDSQVRTYQAATKGCNRTSRLTPHRWKKNLVCPKTTKFNAKRALPDRQHPRRFTWSKDQPSDLTRAARREILRDAVFLCTTPLVTPRISSGSAARRAANAVS